MDFIDNLWYNIIIMGLFRKTSVKAETATTTTGPKYEPRSLYLMRHGPNIIEKRFWPDKDSELLKNVAKLIGRHILDNYNSPEELDIFATNTYRTAITTSIIAEALDGQLKINNYAKIPDYHTGGQDNSRKIMMTDAADSIHYPNQPTLIVAHEFSADNFSRHGASDYSDVMLRPAQVIFIRNDEPAQVLNNGVIS